MYSFYTTGWEPNGTSTIVVVDNNSMKAVAAIEEGVFGLDWKKQHDHYIILNEHGEIELTHDYNPQDHVALREVTHMELLSHIATSPIDPTGERVIRELDKYLQVA